MKHKKWFTFLFAVLQALSACQAVPPLDVESRAPVVQERPAQDAALPASGPDQNTAAFPKLHPEWTSYTNGNMITEIVVQGAFVWTGGSGGVVRWDTRSGDYVKVTTEYGLPSNAILSMAAGPDGSMWFGALGGLSLYEPAE